MIVRDAFTIKALYRSFVRPLLESAVPAWNPHNRADIDAIEKVQKRALRMISNLGHMNYEDKLKTLGLQTLEDRRLRGDLIETYKYLNGFINTDPNKLFTFVKDRHSIDTRSHANDCLVPEKTHLNIRKYFYVNRITNAWNSLPSEIRTATSINSFKNMYDDHLTNTL